MAAPVQRCTVCGTDNDIIRLTCKDCGAVLHERIATLNLFETALNVLIEPADTFIRIGRSEQRNYVLFLFMLLGVLLYTLFLAFTGTADLGFHLGVIILSYFVGAPLFGLLLSLISAAISYSVAPLDLKGRRWKLHLGIYAWGMVPAAMAAPVLVVLSFAIFGSYLFSLDYTVLEYKPLIFYVVAGIMVATIAYGILLIRRGFSALGMPGGKAALQAVVFPAVLALLLAGIISGTNYVIRLTEFSL